MGMVKFNGNELKAILAKKKVTQKQLTAGLGLGKNNVCRWVNGRFTPSVGDVLSILKFLGYSQSEAKEVFWTLYN